MNKIKPFYEQAKRDGNPIWSTYEYLIPELRESEDDESFLDSIEEAISFYYDLNHAPQYHYWLEDKLKSIRPYKNK